MTEHPTRTANARATRKAQKTRLDSFAPQAEAAKALAHPKRLLILTTLADGRERSVSHLQNALGVSQSNVSQNLAILREAGLVTTRREGTVVHYKIRDARVAEAIQLLAQVADDAALDAEPTLAKREASRKRTKLLAIGVTIGLVATFAFAALHPLLNGGGLPEVASHVRAMAASPDLGGMAATCKDVAMAGGSGATSAATPPMA